MIGMGFTTIVATRQAQGRRRGKVSQKWIRRLDLGRFPRNAQRDGPTPRPIVALVARGVVEAL